MKSKLQRQPISAKSATAVAFSLGIMVSQAIAHNNYISDHDADDPPIHLASGVKEQIEKELVFLEQIRPKPISDDGHGDNELERTNRRKKRVIENEQQKELQKPNLSNLAFLDLSIDDKHSLESRYSALMGSQTENDALSALMLEENIQRYLNDNPRDEYHGEGAEDFGEEFAADSELFEEFDYGPFLDDVEDLEEDQIEDNDEDEESEIEKIVEETEGGMSEEERQKQYDELLNDVEQAKLEELIKWMSIQQTAMLSCLAAICLAAVLLCAYKVFCRQQSGVSYGADGRANSIGTEGESMRYLNWSHDEGKLKGKAIGHGSPMTFRNLVKRNNDGTLIQQAGLKALPKSNSPQPQRDYLYSDETPSFLNQKF